MNEITEVKRQIEAKDQEIVDTLFGNLYGKPYREKLARLRMERRALGRKLKDLQDGLNYQNVLF